MSSSAFVQEDEEESGADIANQCIAYWKSGRELESLWRVIDLETPCPIGDFNVCRTHNHAN